MCPSRLAHLLRHEDHVPGACWGLLHPAQFHNLQKHQVAHSFGRPCTGSFNGTVTVHQPRGLWRCHIWTWPQTLTQRRIVIQVCCPLLSQESPGPRLNQENVSHTQPKENQIWDHYPNNLILWFLTLASFNINDPSKGCRALSTSLPPVGTHSPLLAQYEGTFRFLAAWPTVVVEPSVPENWFITRKWNRRTLALL